MVRGLSNDFLKLDIGAKRYIEEVSVKNSDAKCVRNVRNAKPRQRK